MQLAAHECKKANELALKDSRSYLRKLFNFSKP